MSWAAAWLFVKNAGSWLVSNWREVLLVAVAGLILYQHFEVSHYRDEVAGYATATKQAQAQQAQQAAAAQEQKDQAPKPVVNTSGQTTGTLISAIA